MAFEFGYQVALMPKVANREKWRSNAYPGSRPIDIKGIVTLYGSARVYVA